MKTTSEYNQCQTHEIERVLETSHPNYKAVLAESSLLEQVKQLVNQKSQSSASPSRELVIYEAMCCVIHQYANLEVSVWFG
jgi:hypothetical protein